jgi:hypothetical protein
MRQCIFKMDWRKFQCWRRAALVEATPRYEIVSKHDPTNLEQGDAAVVDALRDAGADLSQPREVLHYFYFSNEVDAEAVTTELRRDGFIVRDPVSIDDGTNSPNPWSVRATINAIVSIRSAQESSSRFRALASRHHGEYDGWEAAAKP